MTATVPLTHDDRYEDIRAGAAELTYCRPSETLADLVLHLLIVIVDKVEHFVMDR
jgi:hypothetical protein